MERSGLFAKTNAPGVKQTQAAAVLVVDLATGRGAVAERPRWAAEIWSKASNAAEPLWTARAAGAALKWGLIASPVASAGAYLLTGPHPLYARLKTMMIAGGLSIVCWVALIKQKGKEWHFFLLGVHAGGGAIAGEIVSSYLSWWLTQLPDNPLRAA